MKSSTLLFCVMLSVALVAPLQAWAAPLYQVTVIGGAGSAASDVNNAGQVVGTLAAGAGSHAFFFDGSNLADLGTFGGASSSANGLNDNGTVVGWADAADGTRQAFVTSSGAISGLSLSLSISGSSDASGINNAGAIVGTFEATNSVGDVAPQAYIWTNGVVTQLGPALAENYGFGEQDYGNAINNVGTAVGTAVVNASPNYPSQPFVYANGVMQELGDFGGIISEAWGVNDHGQVVGSAGVETSDTQPNVYAYHAFLYSDGIMQDLGTLNDRYDSVAYDINNVGQVVGRAGAPGGGGGALFADGSITLLDTLIDPVDGWTITNASAINDLGQIAGTACRLGLCYAVRLDLAPIPEPGQVLLLGAGLLALVCRRAMRTPGKRGASLVHNAGSRPAHCRTPPGRSLACSPA